MKALIEKYKPQFKEVGKSLLYGTGAIFGTSIICGIMLTVFPSSSLYVYSFTTYLNFVLVALGVIGLGKLIRKGLNE